MVITVRDRPTTVVTVSLLYLYTVYSGSGADNCAAAIYSIRSAQ